MISISYRLSFQRNDYSTDTGYFPDYDLHAGEDDAHDRAVQRELDDREILKSCPGDEASK